MNRRGFMAALAGAMAWCGLGKPQRPARISWDGLPPLGTPYPDAAWEIEIARHPDTDVTCIAYYKDGKLVEWKVSDRSLIDSVMSAEFYPEWL